MNMDKREPQSNTTTSDNHKPWHIPFATRFLRILKHHREKAVLQREQGNASLAGHFQEPEGSIVSSL